MDTPETFSQETYRKVFGLKKVKDIEYVESLVGALERIDRALLPKPAGHPLQGLISEGDKSVDKLVEMARGSDEQKSLDAIDALAHVFLYTKPSTDALQKLRGLAKTAAEDKNPDKAGLVLKLLAIGRDEALLQEQLRRLDDDDPGVVASAARLLGLGRYAPAVGVLKMLISPDRMFESRWVIWAIGEIGDPDALPQLEYALGSGFRTVDCLVAMGKIGELISVPKLTPMIMSGLPEQRDAAYRALAMILNDNRTIVQDLEALKKDLTELIMSQMADEELTKSGSMRFHMCLCLARLGEKLDVARVKKFLGLSLDENQASQMAGFFMRKGD
jgi:hypothetical protein